MWIEPLEKRELMAASDALLTPFQSVEKADGEGHALSQKSDEPFSGGINTESRGKSRKEVGTSQGDDSVVVIIL